MFPWNLMRVRSIRLVASETLVTLGDMTPNESRYVAYYRVSTDRQGESGLGLDAQRAAVARHLGGASLLAEFQEIESGKNHTNRPQLTGAVELCRRQRATLVIAKLDRLARDVHFISGLMKAGVDFIAVDMPHANKLTVHILAAVAEHEREMISARTKAALAEVKRRGEKRLGNPRWQESIAKARSVRHPKAPAPEVLRMMQQSRDQGKTLRAIALHLNELGLRTPSGRNWHHETIRDILGRAKTKATAKTAP
jgi:DNA invertase Pin-like site-specific DNA recombinase